MAFDATVGGANSNSYITVDDADTYFETRLYSTEWTSADTATKQSALVTATSQLNSYMLWYGDKATDTQALHFPASGIYCNGVLVDDTIIPTAIKNATCEQALYLLKFDSTQTPDAIMQGLKSAKVGSLSAEFDRMNTPEKLQSSIANMLTCYGRAAAGSGGSNMAYNIDVIR